MSGYEEEICEYFGNYSENFENIEQEVCTYNSNFENFSNSEYIDYTEPFETMDGKLMCQGNDAVYKIIRNNESYDGTIPGLCDSTTFSNFIQGKLKFSLMDVEKKIKDTVKTSKSQDMPKEIPSSPKRSKMMEKLQMALENTKSDKSPKK